MLRPPQHDDPRRGQALVEFALTLPLLLMLIFGIIDLARILFAYTQVVDASRQAIRHGIVEGLPASRDQYFNIAQIRQAALDVPGVVTLNPDAVITYKWAGAGSPFICDNGKDAKPCNFGAPATWPTQATFQKADGTMPEVVIEVLVKGKVRPLTPVILPIVNEFNVNYSSSRTIVFEGASYTEKWEKTPPKPQNFRALVDCTNGFVDFYWDSIITDPPNNLSRLEIRSASATGHTVVATPPTTYERCLHAMGCSTVTIPTSGQSPKGSYYLVAFVGYPPLEQASTPSDTAVVACPTAGGTSAIMGSVWHDVDGSGSPNEATGIGGVRVWLKGAGADGIPLTADDVLLSTKTTATDGTYVFGSLTTGKAYVIEVDATSVIEVMGVSAPLAVHYPNATTTNPRVVPVSGATPVTSVNFGYWDAP